MRCLVGSLLLAVLASACRSKERAPTDGEPIVAEPEGAGVRRDEPLEELRRLGRIEGSAVYMGGTTGKFYGLSLGFLERSGRADFERMSSDPAPIVRAMGLLGLALRPGPTTFEF